LTAHLRRIEHARRMAHAPLMIVVQRPNGLIRHLLRQGRMV
jgi:hypothetical protein